jgi:AmiR/NasT family two-component response regulator
MLREIVTRLREANDQLRRALESRIVIEQAKGVLAERFSLSLDEAFELLRDAARSSRANLRSLATTVVSERDRTPNVVLGALARPERWSRRHRDSASTRP